MDISQMKYILEREKELKRKKQIVQQLDIAEAINLAYIGSQAAEKGKTNVNAKTYAKWRRKKYRELNPEIKENTIWGNMKKSKKIN
jgi:hypothetical protein